MPGNTNGKVSQRVYIDQILGPIVKPWIDAHHDFVLEQGDSGHGPGKSNIVRTWKQENKLEYYFNCHSPIENCWHRVKQHLHKYPHWDDNTTKVLIYEGRTTFFGISLMIRSLVCLKGLKRLQLGRAK